MVPPAGIPKGHSPEPRIALTIAGHDPSGGAGITADLLTFAAHGVYGYSAVTAMTVQSTLGVEQVKATSSVFLRRALSLLQADQPPQGIKIGMLESAGAVAAICSFLEVATEGSSPKLFIPIVLDPVIVSSSGTQLLDVAGFTLLRERLLPLVDWVTPNWAELAMLADQPVASETDALAAIAIMGKRYPRLSVVATGGDQAEPCDLLRLPEGTVHHFTGEKIASTSTHGTGCAFSSALLCRIMQGLSADEAVAAAKHYVGEAIRRAPQIGRGHGPLDLLWPLRNQPPS